MNNHPEKKDLPAEQSGGVLPLPGPKSRIARSAVVIIIVGLCLAYLLSVSWLKWGSLLIDTFRDMRIARDLLSGKMLYSGTFYEYGFLPPYIMTFVSLIFGLHILTFAGMGIAVTVLASFLIYRICRLFMDWMLSLFTVVVFLFVFAFGNYQYHAIFNFILPYSFATLFFILFTLCSLYGFLKYLLEGSRIFIWLWITTLTLAFFCRMDMTFPVWMVFAFVILLKTFTQRRNQPAGVTEYCRTAGLAVLPAVAAFAGYAAFLFFTGTFSAFKESNIDLVLLNRHDSVFASLLIGTANLSENLRSMGTSLWLLAISVPVIGLGCMMVSDFLKTGDKRPDWRLFLSVGAIFGIFLFAADIGSQTELLYRCMPIIFLIQALWSFCRTFKNNGAPGDLALFTLSAVSMAVVVRIVFSVSPAAYGFALCLPGLITFHVFLFESISSLFSWRKPDFPKGLYSAVLLTLLLMFVSYYWNGSYTSYLAKTVRIQLNGEELICHNDSQTKCIFEAVEYLLANTRPEDTVIAVPDGETIGVFSGRTNPLRYAYLHPMTITLIGEDKLVSLFKTAGIDFIVFVARATHEQGAARFGADYAKKLYPWILENYDLVKQIGPYPFTTDEFGVAIFRKKQQQ